VIAFTAPLITALSYPNKNGSPVTLWVTGARALSREQGVRG
jgi:hypothetical protein